MDEVMLWTVLAPPAPRSIDVISPFGRELINHIEREYTAKGTRFLPLKPSDTYGCRIRDSENDRPEKDMAKYLNLSQVSIFNVAEQVSGGEKGNKLGTFNSAGIVEPSYRDDGETVFGLLKSHRINYNRRNCESINGIGNVLAPETQFTFDGANELSDEDLEFVAETPMFDNIFSRDKLKMYEKSSCEISHSQYINQQDSRSGRREENFGHSYHEPIVEITEEGRQEWMDQMGLEDNSDYSRTSKNLGQHMFNPQRHLEFPYSNENLIKRNSMDTQFYSANSMEQRNYQRRNIGFEKYDPENYLGMENNGLNYYENVVKDKFVMQKFDYKSVIGQKNISQEHKTDVQTSQTTLCEFNKENIRRGIKMDRSSNQRKMNVPVTNSQYQKIRTLNYPQPKIYQSREATQSKRSTQAKISQTPVDCTEINKYKDLKHSGNARIEYNNLQRNGSNQVIRQFPDRNQDKISNFVEDTGRSISTFKNKLKLEAKVNVKKSKNFLSQNGLSLSVKSQPLLTLENDWCISDNFIESLGVTKTQEIVKEAIEAEDSAIKHEGKEVKGKIENVKVLHIFPGKNREIEQKPEKVCDEFKIDGNSMFEASNLNNNSGWNISSCNNFKINNLTNNANRKLSNSSKLGGKLKSSKFGSNDSSFKSKEISRLKKTTKGQKGQIATRIEVSNKPCKVPKTHQMKITDLLKVKRNISNQITSINKEKGKLECKDKQQLKPVTKNYSLLDFLKYKKTDVGDNEVENVCGDCGIKGEIVPKILEDEDKNLSSVCKENSIESFSSRLSLDGDKMSGGCQKDNKCTNDNIQNLDQFKLNSVETEKTEPINKIPNLINDHSECKTSKLLNQSEINFKIGSVSTNDDRTANNEDAKRKWETLSNASASKKTKFCIPYKSHVANFEGNNERTTSQT